MKAMILAAGLGTRMRPLTNHTPKPLLTAAEKPLIQYHIEGLVNAGIRDIVINTSWLGNQIADFIGDGSAFGASIKISNEETPLETAGGIIQALPYLASEDAFFVLVNGDVWSDFDYQTLINTASQISPSVMAHLVMVDNPSQHPEGDFYLHENGHISQTPPIDNHKSERLTFSGISLLNKALFQPMEKIHSDQPVTAKLAPLLRDAMSEGNVTGIKTHCVWMDIGTPERLDILEAHLSKS